jgi:hypothetical protein
MPEPQEQEPLDTGDAAFLSSKGYNSVDDAPAADDATEEAEPVQADEGDKPESEQQETGEEGEAETTTAEASDSSGDEIEQLVQQFAKETGLDPQDPSQRKTLDRLAHKEQHIHTLEAQIRDNKQSDATDDGLTAAEREISDAYKEEDRPKEEPSPEGEKADAPLYTKWKGPADAYKALAVAWDKAGTHQDYSELNEVDQNIFSARLQASQPFLTRVVNSVLQQQLGELMPDIQASVQTGRADKAREYALTKLSQEEGYANINEVFREDPDAEPIMLDGDKVGNSPLNRILASNPEIMDIHVTHINGKPLSETDSLRLTYLRRFRMIGNNHNRGKGDSQRAKKLVDAGAKMAERTRHDKVRQELNRGPGARSEAKDESYGQTLARASRGGAASLSDL